jgi:GDP-mannose 6-dehydrogenase
MSGAGYEVKIYDKNVSISRLIGKNKSVITEKLPHLDVMLQDELEQVVDWAEVLIIANKEESFKTIKVRLDQIIIDLVRIAELEGQNNYNGLCW